MFILTPLAFCHMQDAVEALVAMPFFNGLLICHRLPPLVMQRGRVEAESVTHKYYNSSTKLKFYKNTRLIGKIIEKTSLTNFY